MKYRFYIFLLLAVMCGSFIACGPVGEVYGLRCESLEDPLAIRLCDLIEGWIVAMQQMCVGDKWEVYIPASMGYGKFSQPGIPGGSTLIFEVELQGVG